MKKKAWRYGTEKPKTPLHYEECGLDEIFLASGYERVSTPYGDAIAIKDQDGLHEAIARHLVASKKALEGKEVRFLRKRMDCTQSGLARLIGVDSQTVARWEKGENKVPGPADRIIRVLYQEFTNNPVTVVELLETLDSLDAPVSDKQLFEDTPSGWKVAA